MALTLAARRPAPPLGLILGGWFIAAFAVGAAGVLGRLPVPPPAIAGMLTASTLAVLALSDGLRRAVLDRGPVPLVALHLVRFVGIYFLVLYGRGELPRDFAQQAGWGDIVVAVGAVLLLLFALPARTRGRRGALLVWNVVGLADILFVIGSAMRLPPAERGAVMPFFHLPLSLLPTFFVPLIIVSHLLIFLWLREETGGRMDDARG
jgi:hypothetical protein